jgi:hypothetical protein
MRTCTLAASLALTTLAFGCGAPPEAEPPAQTPDAHPCGGSAEPDLHIVRSIGFVGADGDVSEGLDLDGVVSDTSDPAGCFKGDFVSPEGTEGIDNQFAALLPALELAAGSDSINGLIERSIHSGNLLLMLGARHVDDPVDDECVAVSVWRAQGEPLIDGLGEVSRNQSFDIDPDVPSFHFTEVSLADGYYEAGPFDFDLPIVIDNFDLFLSLKDARLRYRVQPDGSAKGILAGGLLQDDLAGIIEAVGGASGDVLALIETQVARNRDLLPDAEGRCQAISVSLAFEATPAFFYTDQDTSIPTEDAE